MREHRGLRFVLALSVMILLAPGCKDASTDTSGASGIAAGQEAVEGPAPIVWRGDHDAALAEAAKAGKWTIIDFAADWCAPCKRLDKETFSDPAVIAALEAYVTVRVDGTESVDDVAKEMDRHGVETYPTVVFVSPDGTTLTTPRVEDFMGPKALLSLLKEVK